MQSDKIQLNWRFLLTNWISQTFSNEKQSNLCQLCTPIYQIHSVILGATWMFVCINFDSWDTWVYYIDRVNQKSLEIEPNHHCCLNEGVRTRLTYSKDSFVNYSTFQWQSCTYAFIVMINRRDFNRDAHWHRPNMYFQLESEQLNPLYLFPSNQTHKFFGLLQHF